LEGSRGLKLSKPFRYAPSKPLTSEAALDQTAKPKKKKFELGRKEVGGGRDSLRQRLASFLNSLKERAGTESVQVEKSSTGLVSQRRPRPVVKDGAICRFEEAVPEEVRPSVKRKDTSR